MDISEKRRRTKVVCYAGCYPLVSELILNNTIFEMRMPLFQDNPFPQLGVRPLLNRKIFRGYRVTIREHPYVVSIRRTLAHYCTGALLTKNVIITVAHPFQGVPITELNVVAGENYSDRGTMLHTVVLLIVHEAFDAYTLANDIALLRIYEDLTLRGSVKLIQLISPAYSIHGARAFITGWGRCDHTGRELCLPRSSVHYPKEKIDPMLRTVSFYVRVPSPYCQRYIENDVSIQRGMLCIGPARVEDPTSSCMAVPGAPLVIGGALAGLQSWGFGCGYTLDLPLVYTNILHYQPWLLHNIPLLRNITRRNIEPLFQATKASFLMEWLRKTRVFLPRERTYPFEHIEVIPIDVEIAKLRGIVLDVRDFLHSSMYHKCKRQAYKKIQHKQRKQNKIKLLTTIMEPGDLVPFLSKENIREHDLSVGWNQSVPVDFERSKILTDLLGREEEPNGEVYPDDY